MREVTRYAVWDYYDHAQDIGGKWAKAVEAEAALAENDREWREIADSLQAESDANYAEAEKAEARIKELKAEVQRQTQAQILFGQQFADQQARAAIGKVADRLQAADALADAVEAEIEYWKGEPDEKVADWIWTYGTPDADDIGPKLATYRASGEAP